MASSPRGDSAEPRLPAGRYDQAPGVVGTRQGDTTVLLDVNGGMYYTLNEVGGRIWELLGAGASVAGILQQLQSEYEVAPEILTADMAALIGRLRAAGLIEVAGP